MEDTVVETNNPQGSTQQPQTQEAVVEQPAQGTGVDTSSTGDTFFDPKNLSPELQTVYKQMQSSYTKKTQALSEHRKKSDTLDQLIAYKPFMEWYDRENSGQNRETKPAQEQPSLGLTDEDFEKATTNKEAFNGYVQKLLENQLSQAVMPVVNRAQQEVEQLKNASKIEAFANDHQDFWQLDEQGKILPLIQRYPNLEIEDIYKLAKYESLEHEAILKAHNVVQQKMGAVSEKPGVSLPSTNVVKVKSREEAMRKAWEAAENGQPIPEFEFSR